MKVRCDRKILLDRVGLMAGITATRSTRPILQHILIKVKDGELGLAATDLELSLTNRHEPLACEEEGEIALPGARLLSILREARGETVDITTDGLVALLRSSGSQFRLSGSNPEDFPEIPEPPEEAVVEIPTEAFRRLAERTEFAASRELGRYAINGIQVEVDGDLMRFVATDGRRLAKAEEKLGKKAGSSAQEILPLKGVVQFLKALGPEDEVVGLCLGSRRTFLGVGSTCLSATSVEADFPDYSAVIGVDRTASVELNSEEFFASVRQAAVMAGDDARAVTLEFSEGSLVISSSVEGLGDARVEMAVDYVGETLQVSFNPDFILDFGKAKLPESLPFRFGDSSVSALFEPADGFQYVVMPINT